MKGCLIQYFLSVPICMIQQMAGVQTGNTFWFCWATRCNYCR